MSKLSHRISNAIIKVMTRGKRSCATAYNSESVCYTACTFKILMCVCAPSCKTFWYLYFPSCYFNNHSSEYPIHNNVNNGWVRECHARSVLCMWIKTESRVCVRRREKKSVCFHDNPPFLDKALWQTGKSTHKHAAS